MVKYSEAAEYIREKIGNRKPKILMILGSGLGFLGDILENAVAIPYKDIPGFKTSTALGHASRLICGTLAGQEVLVMQGRMHYYEGYTMREITFPVNVAASLGSDVPFCLMGKTALCEGRGEILSPLTNTARLKFLIVPSTENVSTPWAYGRLDEEFGDFSGRDNSARFNALVSALENGDVKGVAANMYNIFEQVILPERPVARRAKELLLEGGAIGAMMSGSGPTTFGIFEDDETRAAAASLLKENGYYPKVAESMV